MAAEASAALDETGGLEAARQSWYTVPATEMRARRNCVASEKSEGPSE
jgi:hypothetical protein